ncbi:unnamed protein product, partial [Rotaria socialis]
MQQDGALNGLVMCLMNMMYSRLVLDH